MREVKENAREPADLDGVLAVGATVVTVPERGDPCGARSRQMRVTVRAIGALLETKQI